MKKLATALSLALMMMLSSVVFAQSVSSFNYYPIHGLSVTPEVFTNTSQAYQVTLSSDAYLLSNGVKYGITDIFGFYAVSDSGVRFNATGRNLYSGMWSWNGSSGSTTLAGWDNNNKKASITPGTSKSFAFDSFSFGNAAPTMGYHLRVSPVNGASPFAGGLTAYVMAQSVPDPAPVPEPGTLLSTLTLMMPAGTLFLKRK